MMPNQQVGYPISVIPQQGQQLGYSPAYNPQPIQQPQSAYSPSYSEVDKSSYSAEYTPGQTTSPTAYPSPPPAYPLQPTNQYAPIPMASPVESSIVGEVESFSSNLTGHSILFHLMLHRVLRFRL